MIDRRVSRRCVLLYLGGSALGSGCGRSEGPREVASAESPELRAMRVLGVAQKLEREQKTKEAFSAYHQIVRHFPNTPPAKIAAERIKKAQRATPVKKKAK